VLEQSVDTSTAAGQAFFGMLAVFAAFETDVRRERRMEGIAMAKRKGVYTGGKARLDRERVKKLAQDGVVPAKIARARDGAQLGVQAPAGGGGLQRINDRRESRTGP
jgi:DNA invertase Pin-like site-specific DNA recombinase